MNRVYGWQPDIPDGRDYLYAAVKPRVRLTKSVDLRGKCSVVEDQGKLGSCTANALVGNLEFLDNLPDRTYLDLSRLFIYYNERVILKTIDFDSGARLRDGIKTLKNDGVCAEKTWPYRPARFGAKPSERSYTEAKARVINSYYRLKTLNERLACLADGYPFVFGFTVYESFETPQVAKTGTVPMPTKTERALGGHAVLAVGYDQAKKRFLIRNSWGPKWGAGGYCTMPFAYLETLAADFWTIRK